MLTELTLHNFKSWKAIDKMRLAPITGLFGTNSSGKTSILQWLLLMKQTVNSADRQQVLNLGDDKDPIRLGTFQDIVFGHELTARMDWHVNWTLPNTLKVANPERKNAVLFEDDKMEFASSIGYSQSMTFVQSLRYQFDQHNFHYQPKSETSGKRKSAYKLSVNGPTDFKFKRSLGRVWDLPGPVKCYGFPDQVNSYFQNAGFLTDFQLAFEELFNRVYYLGPLRDYPRRQYTWGGAQPADMGERGEKVVDALLSSQSRGEKISRGKGKPKWSVEEYTAYWLKELGLISEFHVEPVAQGSNIFQVKVQKMPHSTPVLITDVGFGISQILPVIVLCYYVPPGSTVVLEQPEIHLHPAVQSGLADIFIDAAKTRGIQIILESHSEHLLRRLQRRIAEETLSASDCALYFCDVKEGVSVLNPLDIDEYGSIRNWPEDFFGDEIGEMAATTEAAWARISRGHQ